MADLTQVTERVKMYGLRTAEVKCSYCRFMDLSLPYLFALGSFATFHSGSFATRYFSHLFDLSRFATSLFFAVVRQFTVNFSLTTGIHQ